MAKKMKKLTLISDKYVQDKFKNVSCHPLRAPEVSINCQIELDINSNGAVELEVAARKHVKKLIDDRVGIVVKQLPKMAKKVQDIAREYVLKWPQDKPPGELEKKLRVVIDMEIKAHNTMIANAMKGIESAVPGAVESARKEVAKRKSAIRNMKIKTIVKVVMGTGLTLGVTAAALVTIVGGVAIAVASGGTAVIVLAAVGATIAGLGTIAGAALTILATMKKAGGSADKALGDLKKSMKAVSQHTLYVEMSKLPKDERDGAWRTVLKKKFSPAFQALEVKVANYESHINKAIAAGSKANVQFDKLMNQAEKLDTKIKEAKSKGASKKKEVDELKERKNRLEKTAMRTIDIHEKNMEVLIKYQKMAKKIGEIVGDYKKDTPPVLQLANKILATIKEVTPSLNDVLKLVAATGKTTSDMSKVVSKLT